MQTVIVHGKILYPWLPIDAIMKLTPEHPMLSTAKAVEAVAKPLFDKLKLNYFQYCTVYDDGSYTVACNQADWMAFAFEYLYQSKKEPAVYSHISQEQLDKQTYYFLWEPNLPQTPIKLAREFNIANGLCFTERYADHYKLIAFAGPTDNHGIVDTYLNHLNDLMSFIRQFEVNQKALIEKVNTAKIPVPKPQIDKNLSKLLYTQPSDVNRSVVFQNQQGYVTPQEYLCLQYLAKGGTAKEIARQMGLSHRTVESYLQRIKTRFGCHFKSDLIQLFHSIA